MFVPDGEHEFFRVNTKAAVMGKDWTQNIPLRSGDIIYVPKRFVSKISEFIGLFTTTIEPTARTYLRVYDATDPATAVINR